MTLTYEPSRGFGIYVHWPYCTRICPYCDFNVYAAKTRDPIPLVSAILQDLDEWRGRTGAREVGSIFFGGGTPSLIPARDIERIIERIDDLWQLTADAEVSLEANPDEAARFADLAAAGITRLSLGVQSLNDEELKFLGRTHSAHGAIKAIDAAKGVFTSLSLDFIYALPEQSTIEWRRALQRALDLNADHYSLYELTIETGAAFSRAVKRGAWAPADEDQAADLYELTQEICDRAGFPAYEISNHARSEDHKARHNIIYWRSGDWIGVGPGAHGRLTLGGERLATTAERRPTNYISLIEAAGDSHLIEHLTVNDVATERMIMGLRMMDGIPPSDIESLIGRPLNQNALKALMEQNLLLVEPGAFRLTLKGMLLADYVAAQLVDWS